MDLLIEHYDATRGVSDDTREEAQEVAAVGTDRRLDPRTRRRGGIADR
ncbi:MAG: hypothetical protein ACRDRK_27490 [Pseudonocardia sp.]